MAFLEKIIVKFSTFLIFAFLFPKFIFAETIVTGNASEKSEVRTEINGEADTYTKIEVEANGEKKVLETNEPGTHELKVDSKSNATASVEQETKDDDESKPTTIQKILESMSAWIKKILSIFS